MARTTLTGKHPSADKAYIDSGVWKCPDAPIDATVPLQVAQHCGAHHWVGMVDGSGDSYCKWCFATRKFGVEIAKGRPTPPKYRRSNGGNHE